MLSLVRNLASSSRKFLAETVKLQEKKEIAESELKLEFATVNSIS